ncbi:cytochrome b/b6 domain-containing protein [Piscinibacter sp.]|jgi:cytochrome b|uniref:cytochrome b/b6 domain-containing protein n=1 Tax=Piscinibacter sp. TaxID=1903157 RepID=UPI001B6AECB0|nr:cytochrome b/b6 domain-containing protein [Piscinibacter sp.]MBK7532213.1 cytochrome b/b6 domain-containing protein [Piscinibacter sp.]MBL0094746.1 cytochrome b/b6 domain-containing protein [Piscinibacter sp.]MBP6542106.1 cytochrome b/b6 domain-containing protein [Piscinibacter sp.]HOY35557.1 cytochrome b/b6 domain-containing protein [Piscinibacter sp.]HPG80538.1 cytochrome b/b6 domain-containing protein [Piscinibacter sp.]
MKDDAVRVRVWDLPTRLFHWVLAACVIGSVVSAKIGGNAMVWHFRLGYVVFTLLAFRLLWGMVGGRWSRFGSFVYAPATLLRYLRGGSRAEEHHEVGHSPLGALSVFALLVILAAQVGSGLFADDEISNTGPLIKFVSGATSSTLTAWHKTFGQWTILALVALHVAAIAMYRLRRGRDLVRPMLVGDKLLPPGVPPSADSLATRGLALLLVAGCAAGVGWLLSLGD